MNEPPLTHYTRNQLPRWYRTLAHQGEWRLGKRKVVKKEKKHCRCVVRLATALIALNALRRSAL